MPIVNGKYQNPGWRNGQAPAINATELNAISDTLEKVDSSPNNTDYFIIATSTSGYTAAECDFLCDGIADDVEINEAIQQIYSAKKKGIKLLPGEYIITSPIVPIDYMEICGTTLPGESFLLTRTFLVVGSGSLSSIIDSTISRHLTISDIEFSVYYGIEPADSLVILQFGRFSVELYADNVNFSLSTSDKNWQGIVPPPSLGFWMTAQNCRIQNTVFTGLSKGRFQSCQFDSTDFSSVGAIAQETDTFIYYSQFESDVTFSNCQKATLMGNVFYGKLTLSSGENNNFSNNLFPYEDTGITLSSGTSRNIVSANSGVSGWGGVTDNGTGNVVANTSPA